MRALIEVNGPSHRVMTAAALVAILLPGEPDDHDLTVGMAAREFRNFAEWFADMLDEQRGDADLRELEDALIGAETLRDRLQVEVARARAGRPS